MKLSRSASIALASCLASGCAFSDGQPWGLAEISLSASFPATAARRTPEGRVKTDRDYAVEVHRLAVEVDAVHLEQSAGDEGADAGFDPADPPPGFSLCHNGHCHADDGRLVSYEEVAREASGGGSNDFAVARLGTEELIELGPEPVEVPLGECTSGCELVRGELRSGAADLHAVIFEVTAFDLLPERRLPPAGVRFSAELMAEAELSDELDGRIDDGEPVGVRARAVLAMPESMFDGIEWAASSTAALDPIRANLIESEVLDVEIERYDP